MNKNILILVMIFVLPIIGYFCLSHKGGSNVTVATVNHPQMIKFTSNMCSECKRVEPIVNGVAKKYQDSIHYISIPVQVNNKYNEEMMAKYNITLVPTIIILDTHQKVVKRIEGYVDAPTLESYVRKACND